MANQDNETPFDAYYFAHGCGRPYQRDEAWLGFFNGIAKRIAEEIGPSSVLDAGCAMGFLVEGLRSFGIEAYGIDVSHYAIENVHPSVKGYCAEGSIAEDLDREYDLIVCIEVLEHMPAEEAVKAIENLCGHANEVLFSSTPFDYKEATHINVRTPEYWAERFALQGFLRDVDYDASYITPWATRFVRADQPLHRVVQNYERRFFQLWKENSDERELVGTMRRNLSETEQVVQSLTDDRERAEAEITGLNSTIEALIEQRRTAEMEARGRIHRLAEALADQSEETENARVDLEFAREQLAELNVRLDQARAQLGLRESELSQTRESLVIFMRESQRLASEWEHLHRTLAWRIINWVWAVRMRLFPSGSLRGRAYERLVRGGRGTQVHEKRSADPEGSTITSHEQAPPDAVEASVGEGRLPADRRMEVDPVRDPTDVADQHPNVDIIVCVHNALDDTRQCLNSVLENSTAPYHLIVVNDGSEAETQTFIRAFCRDREIKLIENEQARGYTVAANQGMAASTAEFVILLNSDTITPTGWLGRMCACMLSDDRIGVVGPLSNTASWQSVPDIVDGEDWATNPIPEGWSVQDMADAVAADSCRSYPRVSLLNGFCLMIRRSLLDEIGPFDEATFGKGYGEEDDFVLRARARGWQIAVADDVYVYHGQSKSYSSERRLQLTDRAGKALAAKHGQDLVTKSCSEVLAHPVMEGIRAHVANLPERARLIDEGKSKFDGKRVLFALPVALPGGGANVILSEAQAMQAMGVDVRVFNLRNNRESFLAHYRDMTVPVTFGSLPDLVSLARLYDAAVASIYFSVEWLKELEAESQPPVLGYYVQGFEPLMYAPDSPDYNRALASYTTIPGIRAFTKTGWTRRTVFEHTGVECADIGVSLNVDLFRPRVLPSDNGGPVVVSAMVRPSTYYREPELTMRVLRDIAKGYGSKVAIRIFGATAAELDSDTLPQDFAWRSAGILTPAQVARFFNQTDIFLDLSSHQAMGLSAMEAMACGNAVVVPINGGVDAYGQDEGNCLMVDTSSFDDCIMAVRRLVDDEALRTRLQRQAINDLAGCFPERPAYNILKYLFS